MAESMHDELQQSLQQEKDLHANVRSQWMRVNQHLQDERTLRSADESSCKKEVKDEFISRLAQIERRNANVRKSMIEADKHQADQDHMIVELKNTLFDVRQELYMANQRLRESGLGTTEVHHATTRDSTKSPRSRAVASEPSFDHKPYLNMFTRLAHWRRIATELTKAFVMHQSSLLWDKTSKLRYHIRPTVGLLAQVGNAIVEELHSAWKQFVHHPQVAPWALPVLEVIDDYTSTSAKFIRSNFEFIKSHPHYKQLGAWIANLPQHINDISAKLLSGQAAVVKASNLASRTLYLYCVLERWPHFVTAASYLVHHYHESIVLLLEALVALWLLRRLVLRPLFGKGQRRRKRVVIVEKKVVIETKKRV
jgi:hypothetical protein